MANVLLPGARIDIDSASVLRLGPGTVHIPTQTDDQSQGSTPLVVASRPGILCSSQTKNERTYWVDGPSRRYVPAVGEHVCGVVVVRHAEGYRVDIGAAHLASLDALAFQNATKRNKPNLKIGAVVYARVSFAETFAEPEIECYEPTTMQSQGFGELIGGMLIKDMELSRCRHLLTSDELDHIAQNSSFECAIGVNGRVWIKSDSVKDTIRLSKLIKITKQ